MARKIRNNMVAVAMGFTSLAALLIPSTSHATTLLNEWKLDESSGIVAAPAAGAASGKLGSSAIFAPSVLYRGITISPVAAYDPNAVVEFASPAGKFGAGSFTVMFWYKTDFAQAGDVAEVIGNRRDIGHGNFFSVRVKGDGTLVVEVDQDANGTFYKTVNSGAIKVNDNGWHHIAVTRDAAWLRLYIDGAVVATGITPAANITGAYPLRLGRSLPNCCANVLTAKASFDDVQIWDTAIPATAINMAFENANTGVVSGLARKFAPELRFDQDATTFPMSAQTYYAQRVANGAWQTDLPVVENKDPATLSSGTLPTYYDVTICGLQTRISYWSFYGHQADDIFNSGKQEHNGDWEHVMVTLSDDASEIASVTYYQHKGWYSRLAARDGFDLSGATHPIVHVGKDAHGSFYDEGGDGLPSYYGDWRNYGNGKLMDTSRKLVGLGQDNEPWMTADRAGGFDWGYDGCPTHPTQQAPSCNMDACKGSTPFGLDTDGCAASQCKVGDDDDGIECWVDCRSGYTDMGVTCTNWSTLDTYGQDAYGYDYTLPPADLGLLVEVY